MCMTSIMAKAELQEVADALHAAAHSLDAEKLYSQEDLLELDVVPENDVDLLAECINVLQLEGLFKLMNKDGRSCWNVISREEAAKYRTMTQDEALVYSYIESSGREGIWVKMIRNKSNLHQAPLNKCLKTLESKGLIKQLQTQRAPGRRIYMISSLQPPEEISGGPFYSDGSLDQDFISVACFWLQRAIKEKSWDTSSSKLPRKKKRATVTFDMDIEDIADQHRGQSPRSVMKENDSQTIYRPLPPGYLVYPTVSELTHGFNQWGGAHVKLKEDEISQLIDLLCWDGKVEKMRGGEKDSYRAVLPGPVPETIDRGIGEKAFTAAPCGRCPVFDLCEDDGPVNAKTCIYFQDWLSEYEAAVF